LGFLTIKGAKARQSASALGQNPTMQDKKVGLIIVWLPDKKDVRQKNEEDNEEYRTHSSFFCLTSFCPAISILQLERRIFSAIFIQFAM
jgi:hypothetical protein